MNIERLLRRGLIVVALTALAIGLAVWGLGHAAAASRIWALGTIPVAAGLLVGFGTRLGGGCTSGHGVCGIARLSPRSVTATAVFMAAAMLVVALTRHVLGG